MALIFPKTNTPIIIDAQARARVINISHQGITRKSIHFKNIVVTAFGWYIIYPVMHKLLTIFFMEIKLIIPVLVFAAAAEYEQ